MSAVPRPRSKAPAEVCLSVVLPVYNEAAVLEELLRRIDSALKAYGCRYEVIFVNDGSRDESGPTLDRLAAAHDHVRVLHFAANFGHQAAVQAGLEHAGGDAVVVMDADLQDDPAGIPRFVEHWRQGYDVVYAVRVGRKEGPAKRLLFFAFYRLLNLISDTPMPNDVGNFGLMDRRVARLVARLPERDRYFAGLRRWAGFNQVGIPVERGARYDGRPRVSVWGLGRLARTAIFSFSTLPLTVFYVIALLSTLVFLGLGCFTLYHKLFTGLAIPGWTSTILTCCFFGAINSLGIAVLGEYISRIYHQVRGRPLYVVDRKANFPEPSPGPAAPADFSGSGSP
jgi:dolichol-phosphate mannosyltransferase